MWRWARRRGRARGGIIHRWAQASTTINSLEHWWPHVGSSCDDPLMGSDFRATCSPSGGGHMRARATMAASELRQWCSARSSHVSSGGNRQEVRS
jgi:hypothetical protein